ncbi:hypothetical protein [Amycolatopsis granulosa]|uniref:hypothetical protein n=1 Tax=Amycolatopsis granulosa TaxID=185684 RepID=UPI0014220B88|nr:hypothetical protein [Amycolatopsis granulosa]NIH84699.1 hypothetical protein [Amycolatopsis granulosa]
MLYRLRPAATLEWADIPARTTLDHAAEFNSDLDALTWAPAETRVFSNDLLRIAVRHGVATAAGIVLDAVHAVDLGRGDEVRVTQLALDEAKERLRETTGPLLERVMPGWTENDKALDDRHRESMESSIEEFEEDLAEVLAAPVQEELLDHWLQLGGRPPAEPQ